MCEKVYGINLSPYSYIIASVSFYMALDILSVSLSKSLYRAYKGWKSSEISFLEDRIIEEQKGWKLSNLPKTCSSSAKLFFLTRQSYIS